MTELWSGLVDTIANLAESTMSAKGLAIWCDLWVAFSVTYPELELPSRLLRTGVAYLTSGKKETALLDLPEEERRILAQALGLESREAE